MQNINKKPTVLHIVNSNIYSGLENVVINIIESLKEKYNFFYVCKDGPIVDVLKEKSINRIKIDKISKNELIRLENNYKPDLIVAHDYTASLMCGFFIKKTKIIFHLHNNSPWLKNVLHPYNYMFLLSCLRKNVKQILIVSDSIKKEYIFSKNINDKIINVSNPISCFNVTSKIDENKNYNVEYDICCVARLTKQKNPERFIKIIKEIKKENNNIKVIWVGNGELYDEIVNKANELNLSTNIKFVGFQKNPYAYMKKSKVFLLTSDWEGFGLVAFEALALGLPCVVNNVGGLPLIVDDSCGKLCNNDNEIIKEIEKLINNDDYYSSKHLNAIKKSKKLDNIDSYMNNIESTYNDIIAKK